MTDINQISKTVREMVDLEKATMTQIASETSLSVAAVSSFANGNYKGNNQRIAEVLSVWLDNYQQKTALVEPPRFVVTQTARQIWTVFQYAQLAECISVIAGNPGVGKTVAAREYSEKPNVWMMTGSPSCSSVTECLTELADVLEIGEAPRRKGPLARAIRRRLNGTSGLIIIDESDHLSMEALEELRSIQDATRVGMVLIGNLRVLSQMTGDGRRPIELARLFSRIAKPSRIHKAKKADVNAIADAWGVTGEKERKLMHSIAEKAGALRVLSHTLRLAHIMASAEDAPLSEDYIRAAFKDLNVDTDLIALGG